MRSKVRRIITPVVKFIAYLYSTFWVPFVNVVLETGIGWAEEAILTVVRELSSVFVRVLNGISGLFVSLFIGRAHWKRYKSAWSDGEVSESRLTEDGVLSTLNAIVEREVSDDAGPGEGSSKPYPRRTGSLKAADTSSAQSSGSCGSKGKWPFWHGWKRAKRKSRSGALDDGRPPRHTSQLFVAKNYNLSHEAVSYDRGVLEDTMLNLEVFITKLFCHVRVALSSILLVPRRPVKQPVATRPHLRRASFQDMSDLAGRDGMGSVRDVKTRLQRSRSAGAMDDVPRKQVAHRHGDVSVTDLIRSSGYPAEEHEVTTTDGYRLRMDRIPRSGKRVVFFVHGILDTSLSWVCTGATESQAFAAWDSGCDVWLANSRSNPPRLHVDPAFQGPAYWHYSVNELGLHDLHAQIEHIHNVKCRELGAGIVTIPRSAILHSAHRRTSEEGAAAQASNKGSATKTATQSVLSKGRLVPPADSGKESRAAAAKSAQKPATGTSIEAAAQDSASARSTVAQAAVAMASSLYKPASGPVQAGDQQSTPESSAATLPGGQLSYEPSEDSVLRRRHSSHKLTSPDAASVPASIEAELSQGPDTQQDNQQSLPVQDESSPSSLLLPPETELEGVCRAFEEDEQAQAASSLFPSLPTAFNVKPPPAVNAGASQPHHSTASLPGTWSYKASGKTSLGLSWLPAGVAAEEQEALELGAQRAGQYFLSSVAPAVDDVVEIDMQGGSRTARTVSQSAPASRAVLPAAEGKQSGPKEAGSVGTPVNPLSPGTPPLQNGRKAEGCCTQAPWDQPDGVNEADAPAGGAAAPQAAGAAKEPASEISAPPPAVPHKASGSTTHRSSTGADTQEPYTLTGVGHSLGGAALLMYIVQFRRSNRRHRLSRLVLLTPAGFIERLPVIIRPIAFVLPAILQLTTRLFPQVLSLPVFIPTALLRSLMFRLTADMKHLPALTDLFRAWTTYFMNGDSSGWDQALRMAHYNKTSMPAVSLLQAKHMLQWLNTGRFSMFDYGSRDLNVAAYGQPQPVDIAAEYWRINVPVDFAAGKHDGVITPACVKKHWQHMLASSVPGVTYREFDFGHLDFTFSAKQDLRHHVISCIEKGA